MAATRNSDTRRLQNYRQRAAPTEPSVAPVALPPHTARRASRAARLGRLLRTAANALRTLWTIGCNSAALGMKTAVRAFSGANLRWHCGPWLRLGIFSVTLHRHMWQQNGPISARSLECTRNWQVGFAHFSCLCRPRAPLASPNCECMCETVFPTAASISKPDAACPAGDVTVCPRGGRSAGPWELPPGVKLLGMPTGSGKTPADAEELGSQV